MDKIKVPKIAVTAESDNDNDTLKLLSIEETHTDIEDLDVAKTTKTKLKSRLKIKLSNDGYVTDAEDLEFSGAEEEEEFKIPSLPFPDNYFNLDGGTVEEIQENDLTSRKIVSHVKSSGEIRNTHLTIDSSDDRATDIEEYYTESEIEEKSASIVNFETYELDSGVQEKASEKLVDGIGSDIKKSKPRRRRRRNKKNITESPSDEGDDVNETASVKTLTVPAANTESVTDTEDIDVEERNINVVLTTAIEEDLKEQEKTDSESLNSNTDLNEKIRFDEEALDMPCFEKNFSATKCVRDSGGADSDWKEFMKIGETDKSQTLGVSNLPTDEEVLSDFDCYSEHSRAPSPNLQMFDEAVVCYSERSKERNYFQKTSYLSDSEEVVIAGDDKPNRKLHSLRAPAVEEDCHTEVEDLDADNTAKPLVKTARKLSTTDVENMEFSDEEQPVKTFQTRKDLQAAHFRKRKILEKRAPAEVTETEDLEASGEEIVTLSRAETATPTNVHLDLDSMSSSKVHSEHMKKIDLTTPEEQLYIKGGGIEEVRTDLEDLSVSEDDIDLRGHKRLSVDLDEDKITVTVKQINSDISLKWKNYTVKFGIAEAEGNDKQHVLIICL